MRTLRQIFHRPAIRLDLMEASTRPPTAIRNPGFVSFFNASHGSNRRHTDAFDLRLRRQKRVRLAMLIILTALCTWFVLESAQAISTF